MNVVFLNGELVPEDRAVVSVFDRCFLYGDGLFETLRVRNRIPFLWAEHFERLEQGAEFLGIPLPFSSEALREFADQLLTENQMADALLRLTLSRGVGTRGYSPKGAERPFLVMTLQPAPRLDLENVPRWRLATTSFRLPAKEPLAKFKTCNKLPQILARAEAESTDAHEALLLNTNGHVVEAASSNLFWIEDGTVCTPPIASGILPGITRMVIEEICHPLRLRFREALLAPEQLRRVQGVFLSLSSIGIAEAVSLDHRNLPQSPLTPQIYLAYLKLLKAETGG
jgi:aminodeoxychorismate lyase